MIKKTKILPFLCAFSLLSSSLYIKTEATENIQTITIDTNSVHNFISPYIYGITLNSDMTDVSYSFAKNKQVFTDYIFSSDYSNQAFYQNQADVIKTISPEEKFMQLSLIDLYQSSNKPQSFELFSNSIDYATKEWGNSQTSGIKGYFIGSETENLNKIDAEHFKSSVKYDEYTEDYLTFASMIKSSDPKVELFGPGVRNLDGCSSFGNSSDWISSNSSYSWYIDYFLCKIKSEEAEQGTRLLDCLDVHYYSDISKDSPKNIYYNSGKTYEDEIISSVGILYDPNYINEKGEYLKYFQYTPIIPTLQVSIDLYYPGTNISFSEYNFNGENEICGGIAEAEALGIMGFKGVYLACLSPLTDNYSYQKSGINIYTNYDKENSHFGDISIKTAVSNKNDLSVYSSLDSKDDLRMTSVMINKNSALKIKTKINISSDILFKSAEIYSFNQFSPDIKKVQTVNKIKDNSFEYSLEPYTVYMFEFRGVETEESDMTIVSESEINVSDLIVITDISTDTEEPVKYTDPITESDNISKATECSVSESLEDITQITSIPESAPENPITSTITKVPVIVDNKHIPESAVEEPIPSDSDSSKNGVPILIKIIVIILVILVIVKMGEIITTSKF